LNLDCPGCKSRLKVDQAKLPPGATTAICPKCRTKILLPGAGQAAGDISIQCPACSSRLRVNVSRLKPGISQSKCPKCGGVISLPAAPASQPAPEMPFSAQTRRLDPREIGGMLAAGGAAAATPIAVEEVSEHSDLDLGKLIEQKLDRLGTGDSGKQAAVARAMNPPPEAAAPVGMAEPPIRGSVARPAAPEMPRRISDPGSRISPGDPQRRISDAGARPAPGGEPDLPAIRAASGGMSHMLFAGAVGGAIVGVLLAVAGPFFPAMLVPHVPEALASLAGQRASLVLVMAGLSVAAALFAGMARPAGSAGSGAGAAVEATGVSIFRCAVAAGLMGLLAGVGVSLAAGGFEIVTTLAWTVWSAGAGLITAPIARLFAPK